MARSILRISLRALGAILCLLGMFSGVNLTAHAHGYTHDTKGLAATWGLNLPLHAAAAPATPVPFGGPAVDFSTAAVLTRARVLSDSESRLLSGNLGMAERAATVVALRADRRILGLDLYEAPVSPPAGPVASAMALIEHNDIDGALRLVRSDPSSSQVLKSFLDLQVALMQRSVVDGMSSSALVPEIALVTRSALDYAKSLPAVNDPWRAAILHNFATATVPLREAVPAGLRSEGRVAALQALELRKKEGDAARIGVAEYVVGVHMLRAGEGNVAVARFRRAAELLGSANRSDDLAWNTSFLALARRSTGDSAWIVDAEEAARRFRVANDLEGARFLELQVRQ